MGINRRSFFRVLGLTGATLAVGKELSAGSVRYGGIEFYGILYDSTRCKGCRGCEFDCAEAHGFPEPPPSKGLAPIRKTNENCNTVVNTLKSSKGEVYVKRQCMHCNEPACVAACLTQAMHKTMMGPVTWDGDKCMGCRYCMVSCPFDSPKFEYHSPNPKIQKCDMCFERLKTGEPPACAYNCPNEALLYGKRRDLIREARKRINDQPDLYVDHIYGEREAGGTGWLYLSKVPFEELGLNTGVQQSSYPALTKGFLYSVPTIFVLVPSLLLGIHQATKNDNPAQSDEDGQS
ncbi:MAG TPA: 4Fe-4S dicluster domain-containing protein [Bacteroidales bacterium]|nr:4Fe-4S dicluster domain-containing protein [Bacteroidales bacterium]